MIENSDYAGAFLELIPKNISLLLIAALLGLFMGLERERSNKEAGVRTFTLVCLCGSLFAVLELDILLAAGLAMVLLFSIFLALQNYIRREVKGLSLTTSAALLLCYGVGVSVGLDNLEIGIVTAVITAAILDVKSELHGFAGGLTKDEWRSAVKFGIIAFVVSFFLPNETIDPLNTINPLLIWSLVVAISFIGLVNYSLVKKFSSLSILLTSFLGGLANSSSTVVELANRVSDKGNNNLFESSIVLANSSMIIRNFIIILFFLPSLWITVGVPLVAMFGSGMIIAYILSMSNINNFIKSKSIKDEEKNNIELDISSPFSLKVALTFGFFFLIVTVIATLIEEALGSNGFIITMFISGVVSSGTSVTSSVLLISTGKISSQLGAMGIIAGTLSSMLIKSVIVFIAQKLSRESRNRLVLRITAYSIIQAFVGIIVFLIIT